MPTSEQAKLDLLARLPGSGIRQSFAATSAILTPGDAAQFCYVIQTGWVVSHATGDKGRRRVLGLHLPGDLIGIGLPLPRHAAGARALTETTVTAYPPAELFDLIGRDPTAARSALAVAREFAEQIADRLICDTAMSTRGRAARFLLGVVDACRCREIVAPEAATCPLPMSQTEIGEAIGLSLVQTNRLIKRMESEQLIRQGRGSLTIQDEAKLRALAAPPSSDPPEPDDETG